MSNYFGRFFSIVAGVASIVSVFYLLFSNEVNSIIALSIFVIFLLSVLVLLIIGIHLFIKKENENEYKKVSVFTSFVMSDKTHGIFEVYRVIQSKRLILNQVEQNFKWSGSKSPILESDIQKIKTVKINNVGYDKVLLEFSKPLIFNETATIHFRAIIDDFDNKSQPYLDHKVDTDTNVIHFRVVLKYKSECYSSPAKILRKPIFSETPIEYEELGSIPFDKETKSYQYTLVNPTVGYFYRILWEK